MKADEDRLMIRIRGGGEDYCEAGNPKVMPCVFLAYATSQALAHLRV